MIVSETIVVRLYGVVPAEQRAETVHSLQRTSSPDSYPVVETLSALAAWKVAA